MKNYESNVPCVNLDDVTPAGRAREFGPDITKTYLYNFDPLKPHFYIVKLGFAGVQVIFSFLLKTWIVGSR